MRIISVVPSQTELLFDLRLDEEVVGITKFCIHPDEWFRSKIRIGGTKNLNIDLIKSLKPDLIFANKEENEESQVRQLMNEFKVIVTDVKNLDDAYKMISEISIAVGKEKEGIELIGKIKNEFNGNTSRDAINRVSTCAYLIWKNPWMVAGNDTFISSMLPFVGLKNLFSKNRYPEVTIEELQQLNPQVILLSSEPYPFKEKDVDELRALFPKSTIRLADGEMFSWYGSRLLKSPAYFSEFREKIQAVF
jgi:ABC-type Fe3+-hydroxamate transport system substrate-binding protein